MSLASVVGKCRFKVDRFAHMVLIVQYGLFPNLSEPACCLRMEISFSIVLERNTLMKNEVNEDGRVAVSAPV